MMNTRVTNLDNNLVPVGADREVTAGVTAAALIVTALDDATRVVRINVTDESVRVRWHGTPTDTRGSVLPEGYTGFWSRRAAEAASVIRAGGDDAKIEVAEFGY